MKCLVFILLMSVVSFAQSTGPGMEDDYRIVPDDLVDVAVFQVADLNATSRVSSSGYITLPLIGNIKAAGSTTAALAQRIESELRKTYLTDPHVIVSIKEYATQPISVIGEVRSPGVQLVRKPKRLIDVLASVGGTTNSSSKLIQITRGSMTADYTNAQDTGIHKGDVLSISVEDLFQKAKPEANVLIYGGDVVNVLSPPPPPASIFIVGEIAKPGEIPLKNEKTLTIRQAIASSGGLTKQAKVQECTIIRYQEDGSKQEIRLNLEKLTQISLDDMPLMPGDIVFIPSKKTGGSVGRNILQYTLPAVFTQAVYVLLRR